MCDAFSTNQKHDGHSECSSHAFVMAASHSGSTLLTMLIAAHPNAATIGSTAGIIESEDVEAYVCSCGLRIRACPFWQHVTAAMQQRGIEYDLRNAKTRYRVSSGWFTNRVLTAEYRGGLMEGVRDLALTLSTVWRKQYPEIQKRIAALLEIVLEFHGASLLVDSSKLPQRLKFMLRIPSLRTKVIHLVRDGRAVALTYIEQNKWPMRQAASEWRRNVRASEKLLGGLQREQWKQVRYEDLCEQPVKTLDTIFEFLGLEPLHGLPDFRAAGNHVIGNKMRLEKTTEVRLDNVWKTILSGKQLAVFQRVAGNVNRDYGYD